jgi:hypothetical protein
MARIQIRIGDSGDVPVTFAGDTIQQLITCRDNGTVTVTTSNCSLYPFLNGVPLAKCPRDSTRSYLVQAGQTFDVQVTGTTDANPNGNVHYDYTA